MRPAEPPVASQDRVRTTQSTTSTSAASRKRKTTTPFDMVVRNELDRFHLAIDVIDRVLGLL
jgi:xylulose-5-phosphate/fructose-6-phosphate phosphoketolase